jgi:hypothetical protein
MTTARECWCSDGWSAGAGSGRRPRRGGGAGVDRARRPHRRHAGVPRRARRTPSDPRPRLTPSTAFERSRQCRGRSAQGPHCPRNPRRALRGHTGQAHQPFQEIPDEFNARVDAFWREVERPRPTRPHHQQRTIEMAHTSATDVGPSQRGDQGSLLGAAGRTTSQRRSRSSTAGPRTSREGPSGPRARSDSRPADRRSAAA